MSATDRQNRLLLAEDWKRIYQSFRNADFQSYDFDTLRRTMINYLRRNYPEDFNDYVESSEYLALIDLIAFLGQNISFRVDLNSRDNFLELADRRESVLRLARLISYNPKRNIAANGLLKITGIKTTENVTDSSGRGLSGQTIGWNDPSNPDWYEQFIKVMNSALPINNVFGKPNKKDTVNGIATEQYKFNAINTDLPKYKFTKTVQGSSYPFEIVSTDVNDGNIEEEIPLIGNSFAVIYQNDGKGAGSNTNGFFSHFRQGSLESGEFTITTPTTNQVISIDATDINNSDVWLYKLDQTGREDEFWTKLESLEGNNIIYNSISKQIRNVYSALTRVNDRINLMFSDGVFGNLPKGTFRIYYRTSANRRIVINPADMLGVNVRVPYLSRKGTSETLTITYELKYTVDNSSPSETSESIKTNAPATYYTQNRMITGEDYNVAPLTVSQEIIKTKAVNRIASGISRYYDLLDSTGKYSKTNLYGADGIIYKELLNSKTSFTFQTQTDIEGVIVNLIEPILQDRKILNYYYEKFPKIITTDLQASWQQVTSDTNRSTGYLTDADGTVYSVGSFTANSLRFLEAGTLCKFISPPGQYFLPNGTLTANGTQLGATSYKWTKVAGVITDGTTVTTIGLGPITFNDIIPTGAILSELRPRLTTTLIKDVRTQIIDQAYSYNVFGLRYDVNTRLWRLITESNLNVTNEFSTGKTGDTNNQQLDSSWLLLFQTNGEKYTVTYRGLRYIFESDQEIKFFYDSSDKVYDIKTGEIIKDKISVLNINPQSQTIVTPFTRNFDWEILAEYRDREGYVDSKKIQIGFFDSDDDGIVDDLSIFDELVQETVDSLTKYVYQEKYLTSDGVEDYRYTSTSGIVAVASESGIGSPSLWDNGQVFYIADTGVFKSLTNGKLLLTTDYRAFIGRDDLKFHYIHAADSNSRIDPSSSNIMDVYLLTKQYDTLYRQFLNGALPAEPMPPSSDSLYRSYNADLEKIKSISDEIIYHPVKYKVLFGNTADSKLQATFKVVKNSELVLNNNDIKTRVIGAINSYFALENWEFGETFYFSELSTYIMNQLAPDLVTVVIVPIQEGQVFGSLYEIKAESDEIFISGATVDDVEIIDSITATRLSAPGNITTSTASNTNLVQSEAFSSSATNIGGFDY
jgi:hypothetical protein